MTYDGSPSPETVLRRIRRPHLAAVVGLGALLLGATGCLATVEGEVESATSRILEKLGEVPETQRIAVVGTTERHFRTHLATIWDFTDGTIVNHPHFDGVSPDLVRDVLHRLGRDIKELYAERGRYELLSALEAEGQCPDYLLYLQLSRLRKSGPGVAAPEYLVSFELIDVSNGNRVGKETATVMMTRYR